MSYRWTRVNNEPWFNVKRLFSSSLTPASIKINDIKFNSRIHDESLKADVFSNIYD